MVQREQKEGLDKLGLDSGSPNSEQRLAGKYGRPLEAPAQMSPVKRKSAGSRKTPR